MPAECTFIIVVAVSGFSIQCVARTAALQPDARVGPNRIIAPLTFQALMCINLTFVNIHTRVGDLIEREANFAVAPKTADFVGAHLVAVAGVFIDGTFINIYTLLVVASKTRCTGFDLLLRREWIVFHHGDTVVRAFYVDALEAFVTGRLVLALVDIFTFSCLTVVAVSSIALDILNVQAPVTAFKIHTNLIVGIAGGFTGFTLVHIGALTCPLVFLIATSTIGTIQNLRR